MSKKPKFVKIPVEVIEFLTGSAPLNGRWYGEVDDENGKKRPYWWRSYLNPNKLVYDKDKRTIVKAPPRSPQHGG